MENPTRVVKVGKNLETTTKNKLVELLKENQEVFAWSHKDMVGIDPTGIGHVLNIDKNFHLCNKKVGFSTKTDQRP